MGENRTQISHPEDKLQRGHDTCFVGCLQEDISAEAVPERLLRKGFAILDRLQHAMETFGLQG
jgi:hypothetical protein